MYLRIQAEDRKRTHHWAVLKQSFEYLTLPKRSPFEAI